MADALHKVTAFITRGSGAAAELLVFQHPTAGIQVPAGTVDPDEDFEAAGLREAREESGIDRLRLIDCLGERTYRLADDERVALTTLGLRPRPSADSHPSEPYPIRRGFIVRVVDARAGFLRGVYETVNLDDPSLVMVRLEGWAPAGAFASTQVRRFYHFVPEVETPASWSVEEEGHLWQLYWAPLGRPPMLFSNQAQWLAEFRDRLLAATACPG